MSKASAIGQVIFMQQAGVFMPMIQCNHGDLYQEYLGDASAPTNIAPDFVSLQPILSFILTSSRVADGLVTPSSVEWYFNGVKIEFASSVSTNNFGGETGHFKWVDKAANGGYFGLQIVRNLVKASVGAACNIECRAVVSVGNISDTIKFQISIPITKSVGNQKHVRITAGDNKYFTLVDKDSSCILKAITRMGAEEITNNLTYKWYKMINGAWAILPDRTSQTLTVTSAMVDTTAMIKVEVYQSESIIGQDVQSVVDASDPFDIIVGADPEDQTIRNSGDTVTLIPILVKRGSTTKYMDMLFYFSLMDSAGVLLNVGDNTTALESYQVTYDHCRQAGGSVTYTIMTAE